jgi:hypothetical protein
MFTLLLFSDAGSAPPINVWTILIPVISAIVTAALTFVGMRRKNSGDAWKSLTDACSMLARELRAALDEIPIFRNKIQTLEREKDLHAHQSAAWEELAVQRQRCIIALQEDAAAIVEDISHLTFITAGPPSEEDKKALRRLKNIRDTGKRIASLDCGLTLTDPVAITDTQHYENPTHTDRKDPA